MFAGLVRAGHVLVDRPARFAVAAERLYRRWRHRVDAIRPDQFLHVEDVTVCLVLGASARP